MEENKVKIFWMPADGGEPKELKGVTKMEGLEPLEKPVNVQYDTTPETKEY